MTRELLFHYAYTLKDVLDATLDPEWDHIDKAASFLKETLRSGGKIMSCGNGGSMAESTHYSAEGVVRLKKDRVALPFLALGTNPAVVTACGNDYDFEEIFAREVQAFGTKGDSLLCLSTSGQSANVNKAALSAKYKGCKVISLTGSKPNTLEGLSDAHIKVRSEDPARIQEVQLLLLHYLAEQAEQYQVNI